MEEVMNEVVFCDPRTTRLGWTPPNGWCGFWCIVEVMLRGAGLTERQSWIVGRGDWVSADLIESSELQPEDDVGYRVYYSHREAPHFCDIVLREDGWIRVTLSLNVDSPIESVVNPDNYQEGYFNQGLEYLMERPPA
jgi:hypothetical protein